LAIAPEKWRADNMSSSHPSDKQYSTYLPQIGIYMLMAVLGAVLTLAAGYTSVSST
jgi:hypothetical protein